MLLIHVCILESETLSSDKWLNSRILFPCHMSIEKMERTPANIVDDDILSDKKKMCALSLYPYPAVTETLSRERSACTNMHSDLSLHSPMLCH